MDKRQAKKYHAKLFKNKSDLASGKTIGLYQQDLKNLVAIRKSKGLSYADAESGSAKYFSDIKLIAPEDGEADPLKNQIQMKSRKYFKADGGKTKEHPDNRVSRRKDPKRFEGTDLEYLSIAEKGGHEGKARYGGKTKVKRQHAPKFRGKYTNEHEVVKQAPSLPSQLLSGFEKTQERQMLEGNVKGFTQVREPIDREDALDTSFYVGDRQAVMEDKRFTRKGLGHTGFQIGKFVGGERQEMNRRFTEAIYRTNIYDDSGLIKKGIGNPSYHPTQKQADHKSSSLRATYPDQYKSFGGQGVSQLLNLKPSQRKLKGEGQTGRLSRSFGERGLKGYTPQPQLGTITETKPRKLIIKKKKYAKPKPKPKPKKKKKLIIKPKKKP